MLGMIYMNSTALPNLRLDQKRIVYSLECPCRHSFLWPKRFNNYRSYGIIFDDENYIVGLSAAPSPVLRLLIKWLIPRWACA